VYPEQLTRKMNQNIKTKKPQQRRVETQCIADRRQCKLAEKAKQPKKLHNSARFFPTGCAKNTKNHDVQNCNLRINI